MKNKLWAAIKKETLILIRDKVGLSILFIMPMVLILVMTLIQDSAFRTINEKGVPIVLVDNDHDTLGVSILNGLKQASMCDLKDSIDGKLATIESAKKAVSEGKFLIGIIIPEGATKAIRNNVSGLINETFSMDSLVINPKDAEADSVNITLFIDPITKKSFITTVNSYLHEFISTVKTKIMFQTFSDQISQIIPDTSTTHAPKNTYAKSQIINYKEVYSSDIVGDVMPNAVQHNVPAWTIFAMFFIVIPLVGSVMKEKKDGSAFRLYTIPTPYLTLINGKVIVYVFVCMLQFFLMLCVGLFILPLMGLPMLQLGNSILGIFIIGLSTSLAATGYGVMVGTIAASEQQGAILGSLSILLLSALGGIWVPTYIMPEIMRHISKISPLNWALEGFYKLFFRGSGASGVLIDSSKLILFFVFTMVIASLVNRLKRRV